MLAYSIMDLYSQKYIELIALSFILLGAFVIGIQGFFNVNVIEMLARKAFAKRGPLFERVMYITIGLCALLFLFSRDYYLPFLGDAVYPCGSLLEKVPIGADTEVITWTEPDSSVIYWAAESSKQVKPNPWMAYSQNTNAGVTRSDPRGKTVFKVRKPTSYYVGNKELKPHVHYRVCKGHGMLGSVRTTNIVEQEAV